MEEEKSGHRQKLEDTIEAIVWEQVQGQHPLLEQRLTSMLPLEVLSWASFTAEELVLALNKRLKEHGSLRALTPESLYYEVFRFVAAHRKGLERNVQDQRLNLASLREHLQNVFGRQQLDQIHYKDVHKYVITAQDQISTLKHVHGFPRLSQRPVGGDVTCDDYSNRLERFKQKDFFQEWFVTRSKAKERLNKFMHEKREREKLRRLETRKRKRRSQSSGSSGSSRRIEGKKRKEAKGRKMTTEERQNLRVVDPFKIYNQHQQKNE